MSKGGRILIAVVLGLLAAMFGMMYLSAQRDQILGSSEVVRVYVASEDIPANVALDKDKVLLREIPRAFVQPQAITAQDIPDKANIKGVPVVEIREGEQIVRTKLFEGAAPPLAKDLLTRKGKVGVSVKVKDLPQSLHGLIRPGNRVDVLAQFKFEKSEKEDFTEVRPLMTKVEVIAVNDFTISTVRPYVPAKPGEEEVRDKVLTVTLALDPAGAQQVILAQELGTIWLLLRAEGDGTDYAYEVWNNERLLKSPFRLWRGNEQERLIEQFAQRQ